MKKNIYKIIAIIAGVAAVACAAVGGYKYYQEKHAGDNYEEVRETVKKETEPAPVEEKDLLKSQLILQHCRNRIRKYMHGFRFKTQTLIIQSFKEKEITDITWTIRSTERRRQKVPYLPKIITAKILKIRIQ